MCNPYYGPVNTNSPQFKRAQAMDQVHYNHFNFNVQFSIKLRFDGKKRRDGLRITM